MQERMLQGCAMMHGLEIAAASPRRRPLVASPSFRDTADALATLEHFREHGLDLHLLDRGGSVIKSGVSELIFTLLVACAKFERFRIRERI